jgi:hypothetical protein
MHLMVHVLAAGAFEKGGAENEALNVSSPVRCRREDISMTLIDNH